MGAGRDRLGHALLRSSPPTAFPIARQAAGVYGRRMGDVSLSFAGCDFLPLPCGALFWPGQQMLILADLHLEKGSYFAGHGWLLPPHDSLDTLQRLERAVRETGARRIAALGDSFHDNDGPSRLLPEARMALAALMGSVEWHWITGNHDGESAGTLGGFVHAELVIDGIALRHEACPGIPGPEISGHFHPKVTISLRTGGRVTRRCIAMAGQRLVLPAYGAYAGGLDIGDPAFVRALGGRPRGVVALSGGLLKVDASGRPGPAGRSGGKELAA